MFYEFYEMLNCVSKDIKLTEDRYANTCTQKLLYKYKAHIQVKQRFTCCWADWYERNCGIQIGKQEVPTAHVNSEYLVGLI